jgi:hypothetical protein
MAHGKKRWIETYDGRIKRSNDLTWKDWRSDLKYWQPMETGRRYFSRRSRVNTRKGIENFCPQCKHVQKEIVRQRDENYAAWDALHAEHSAKYSAAEHEWERYNREKYWWGVYVADPKAKFVTFPREPKVKVPPSIFEWMRQEGIDRPMQWTYDQRSFLCYKCEFKYETDWNQKYYLTPGCKENYTWLRKRHRTKYRAQVKQIIRKNRHFEGYDWEEEILPYCPGWLD